MEQLPSRRRPRAHPKRVQAVAAASAVGQEHGFVFAFEPALRCAPLDARLIRQPSCNQAMQDPQHRADGVGLAGEQEA